MKRFFLFFGNLAACIVENFSTLVCQGLAYGEQPLCKTHSRRSKVSPTTGGPSSLHERGRDSCLRVVLCYKRLFIKACMGCKQFFLKERKNVMLFNKIDLPNCLVVFFVVCPRLRPFWSVFGELALFWCYFQLSSQCFIEWWNTASHAWYITSQSITQLFSLVYYTAGKWFIRQITP